MKKIIIWGCILLFLCGVISIPFLEENWHIKNDTNTFGPKYFPVEVVIIDSIKPNHGKKVK